MPDVHQRELSQTFAEIAQALLCEDTVEATLQRIAELAVETIEHCDFAGMTLVRGRLMTTPASTTQIPTQVDAIQLDTGEGPCLDAIREHEVFHTDDLSLEERWPNFARRAVEMTQVRSMLCFRLFVEEDTLGALNLYSRSPAAFDDDDRTVGSVFAAHAAVALSTAQHDQQMQDALRTRDTIGQAKGILMARQGVTADQAFDMLRRGSQRLNIKLAELARRVTEGGAGADQVGPPPTN